MNQVFVALTAALTNSGPALQQATQAPTPSPQAANCVTIAPPPATKIYTYEHIDPSGTTTSTQQWESVTATGSRVRTAGPAGTEIVVNVYRVIDDVAHISQSVKTNANGASLSTTVFAPPIVSDPTVRACAGREWAIPASTATFQSGSGQTASATAKGGSLKIINIRERITVPAGTFDTVHYMRVTQSADEYWKSIDQGVVVKHIATVQGGRVVDTLVSVK